MKLSLLFVVLLSASVFADPAVVVLSRTPTAVRKYFPADQYRVMDAASEERAMSESGYLLPSRRDALFRKLKLEKAVEGLDEMDKDTLVMAARSVEISALKEQFPSLSEEQLRRLQKEMRQMAKK